ncbi:MAG: hypothetical protein ACP5O2_05470 [Bacteroidales bacterium]
MKRVFLILLAITELAFSLSLSAQEDVTPTFTISLKDKYNYDNLLNYEEIECVIYEKTLGEKGLKATLRIDERFAERNGNCSFPVLQLNLPKKKTIGSILEGYNKIEIIPICSLSDVYTYSDKLLLEAWLYRIAGVMFRMEPRVKQVKLRLSGFSPIQEDISFPAIFLESPEDLAQRFEGQNLELHLLQPWLLDQEALTEFIIFQLFTQNSRWALETLHSMVLLSVPGKPPVPYPLDNSSSELMNLMNDSYIFEDPGHNYTEACVQKEAFLKVASNLSFARNEIIQSIDNIYFSNHEINHRLREYTVRFFDWLNEARKTDIKNIICPEESGR